MALELQLINLFEYPFTRPCRASKSVENLQKARLELQKSFRLNYQTRGRTETSRTGNIVVMKERFTMMSLMTHPVRRVGTAKKYIIKKYII
jgi:hypothetical protein